jgi:hypothetical protein
MSHSYANTTSPADKICNTHDMDPWHREVSELHDFFEAYFLGTAPAGELDRLEVALADGFTIVGPHGVESSRAETVDAIRAGHGHSSHLRITVTEARLISDEGDTVTSRYVENHELADRTNHRLSTVVFVRSADAPNGLRWRTVHETWIESRRS